MAHNWDFGAHVVFQNKRTEIMVQLERLRLMAHIGYLPFRSFAGLEQRTMERSNPIMFVSLRDCPVLIRQLSIIFVKNGA